METLIITLDLCRGVWFLSDARGNLIGRFNSADLAAQWAKDNGYRSRVQ